jgi:hypothetical protein
MLIFQTEEAKKPGTADRRTNTTLPVWAGESQIMEFFMKNTNKFLKMFGTVAIAVLMAFSMAACGGDDCKHSQSTWTVTDTTDFPAQSTRTCNDCDDDTTRDTAIGDIGPGGGRVIFVTQPNHLPFPIRGGTETAYYLEVSMVTPPPGGYLKWASAGKETDEIPGLADALLHFVTLGDGKANTAAILVADPDAPAAKACRDYRGGGKDDWFLPSQEELREMAKNRAALGITQNWSIWTSNQATSAPTLNPPIEPATHARTVQMSSHGADGFFHEFPKDSTNPVTRAMRYF